MIIRDDGDDFDDDDDDDDNRVLISGRAINNQKCS